MKRRQEMKAVALALMAAAFALPSVAETAAVFENPVIATDWPSFDGGKPKRFERRFKAAELVRRHPGTCTDLWGNPLDVAVWPEGTLVYRMRRGDCCLGVKEASCKFHAQMEPRCFWA